MERVNQQQTEIVGCFNCRHYRRIIQESDESTYGSCHLDRLLIVGGDLYCDYWEAGPPSRALPPPRVQDQTPELPSEITLSAETEFWLQRIKAAIAEIDHDDLQALAADLARLAAIRLAVIHCVCPGYSEVIAEFEEEDED